MGVIHDIGKLFLMKTITEISPDESFDNSDLQDALDEVHTFFGAMLITKWNFPENFTQVVKNHHWEKFPENTAQEILIVHTADTLVTEIGYGSQKIDPDYDSEDNATENLLSAFTQLGIDPDRIKIIKKMVFDSMKSVSNLF